MFQKRIDLFYLKEAYKFAQNSPDRSTQNGAILVKDNSVFLLENILAWGINEHPIGVIRSEERLNRPLKYNYTEHAERNVIFSAAKKGVKTEGLIMYVPWFACDECARAIIQAGIKEVIGYTGPEKWSREKAVLERKAIDWRKSIERGLEMFDEAGVKYRWVDGHIGDVKVLFGGEFVYP
jgi:dCMP deaminase